MDELSLLQQIEASGCKVDVDSFDPLVARSLPFKAHDATSNQGLIGLCIMAEENLPLVRKVVQDTARETSFDILTVLHAKFAKIQLINLTGRVLVQTSPSFSNDKAKIIQHARSYAKALADQDISNDRFCIKIPTTSAGVQAAAILQKEGIDTLGTILFSIPQAIAAYQAGMWAISPYFNPVGAHRDPYKWHDTSDPLKDRPASSLILEVRQIYDHLSKESGSPCPQIKAAGFTAAREVLAQPGLGCDHVTILPPALADLSKFSRIPPYQPGENVEGWSSRHAYTDLSWDAWEKRGSSQLFVRKEITGIDFLAGNVLDEWVSRDAEVQGMLEDAIETFRLAEQQLFAFIDSLRS